jgi:hypothetical protein
VVGIGGGRATSSLITVALPAQNHAGSAISCHGGVLPIPGLLSRSSLPPAPERGAQIRMSVRPNRSLHSSRAGRSVVALQWRLAAYYQTLARYEAAKAGTGYRPQAFVVCSEGARSSLAERDAFTPCRTAPVASAALRGLTPASIRLPPCSPASRPLRAGFADGLRPVLTQAMRDSVDVDGRDGETPLDRTEKHRHDGRGGNPGFYF